MFCIALFITKNKFIVYEKDNNNYRFIFFRLLQI
jgi:hypothetical protein